MSTPNYAQAAWEAVRPSLAGNFEAYPNRETLQHYKHVAGVLHNRLGDEALGLAGLLWGIPQSEASQLIMRCGQGKYEQDVSELLKARDELLALAKGPQRSRRAIIDFLSARDDLRFAVLLIVETLLRCDPDDEMAQFSRTFHISPGCLPLRLRTIPDEAPYGDVAAFLEHAVAPACDFVGLIPERNLAEDLALYQRDRLRMEEFLGFVKDDCVTQEITHRVDVIKEVLAEGFKDVQVLSRWHHIASIERRIREEAGFGDQRHRISVSSRLVLRCSSEQRCYEVLGRLSLLPGPAFESHQRDFADYLANPKPSGYRAIHTTLVHRSESGTARLRIEILPDDCDDERLSPLNMTALEKRGSKCGETSFVVYTADGKSKSLALGSRVINFVSEVHGELVATARGAFVNRIWVDLLHPLQPGDIVQIDVGTELREELPPGWAQRVPKSTVRRIRQGHNSALRRSLIDRGRSYLCQELVDRGIPYAREIDPLSLDSYLHECVRLTAPATATGRSANWWWYQFGLYDGGIELTDRKEQLRQANKEKVNQIISDIAKLLGTSSRIEWDQIRLPTELRGSCRELALCHRCNPQPGSDVVGSIQGGILVIHAKDGCVPDGTIVQWRRRLIREQYFVVEATNWTGLAVEILTQVSRYGVDIVDLAATSLGQAWAVFRIQVQGVGNQLADELKADLEKIEGVNSVFQPWEYDSIPPMLLNALPSPRRTLSILRHLDQAYFTAEAVREDAYFYGREAELRDLDRAYRIANDPIDGMGIVVFVTGPLKVGKTSLVYRFCRELASRHPERAFVQVSAPLLGGWREVASKIRSKLESQVEAYCKRANLPCPKTLECQGVTELCSFLLERSGSLVIFIDEVVRMLDGTPDHADEKDLLSFVGWAENQRGVCLILAGPKASLRRLSRRYRELLEKAREVRVKPLQADAVDRLMRARNSGVAEGVIAATESDVEDVLTRTGGNPYWCNLLGEQAVQLSRDKVRLVYSPELIADAERLALALEEKAFRDRFGDLEWNTQRTALARRIAIVLASREREKAGSVSFAQIVNGIASADIHTTEPEIVDMLGELQDRGAIKKVGDQSWDFEAPILRRFVAGQRHSWETGDSPVPHNTPSSSFP